VDIVKAATRITTILPKQCIKSAVEGFMQNITLLSIHNGPDFIILGSLGTASDKELERAVISLTSCLVVLGVDILGAEGVCMV
jgi:hypothetical protein